MSMNSKTNVVQFPLPSMSQIDRRFDDVMRQLEQLTQMVKAMASDTSTPSEPCAPPLPPEEWLTAPEFAKRIDVSRQCIRDYWQRGLLSRKELNGVWLYRADGFERPKQRRVSVAGNRKKPGTAEMMIRNHNVQVGMTVQGISESVGLADATTRNTLVRMGYVLQGKFDANGRRRSFVVALPAEVES